MDESLHQIISIASDKCAFADQREFEQKNPTFPDKGPMLHHYFPYSPQKNSNLMKGLQVVCAFTATI